MNSAIKTPEPLQNPEASILLLEEYHKTDCCCHQKRLHAECVSPFNGFPKNEKKANCTSGRASLAGLINGYSTQS